MLTQKNIGLTESKETKMAYNLDSIKNKIRELNNEKPKGNDKSKNTKNAPKLQYWKPALGMNVVRFLPYDDGNGQPFQEINYYNSKKLSDRRMIAPAQFNLPDPVADLLESLRPQRAKKEVWNIMKELQMKPSYYALVLVRGQEHLGVQVWEMKQEIVKNIYATLTHPDWVEENLFDAETGYDFTVEVTDSGTEFNGYMVKNFVLSPRRKPEPLAKKKEDREKLIASMPNLLEHNKQYVKNEESLKDLIANFLSQFEESDGRETEDGTEINGEAAAAEEEVQAKTKNVKQKIDAAFDFPE